MNLKAKSALFAMLFMCIAAFAQDGVTINGTVVDAEYNMPLPNVNVVVVGTSNGASTDFDGQYQIQVKSGDVLQFSYIGYTAQTVVVGDQKIIDVSLSVDANTLEEVVVVGYGTRKKSHLTGAISKVVNEDLEDIAVARVDDALVGQVSGVNIQSTDGSAGSAPTITIRGAGSITGSSTPLIVVDGLVVDSDYLGSLDMNDVKSFEVLKDAASTSIYGSRGANGIIMISTKDGKEGKTKFSYNTFTGFKQAKHSDAYTFSVAETAAAELAATGTNSDRTKYKQLLGDNTNWQDIIFDGGNITSHSFAARGGSKKTKFSTALSYLHDEGVLLTDDYKKYSLKLKVDTQLNDKFSFGVNLTPSVTDRRRFDGSTHDILRQPSWLPVYLDEHSIQFVNRLRDGGVYADAQIGDYAQQRMFDNYDLATGTPLASGGTSISNTSNTNPAAKILERDRTDNKFKIFGSVYGKYDISDALSFKLTGGGDIQYTKRRRWQGVQASRNGAAAAQLDLFNEKRVHGSLDGYFAYDKSLGNHEISFVGGMATERWKYSNDAISGNGFTSDKLQTISAATSIIDFSSEEYEDVLFSMFARANYAFNNKYLASVSFRRDGSSIFGANNKFGNFPAFSAGWIVSNESFLEESDFISTLKLRASYGFTGSNALDTNNNQVDFYPSYSLLDPSTAVVNGNITNAYNPINIANEDLQWERLVEFNPGIDFGFANNVITGSLDYYNRTSDQLLLNNPVSATTGFTSALVNLGKVKNSGIELELRSRNVSNENFSWNTTLIASKNENELVDFADSNGQIQNVDSKRAAEWVNLEGQPISSFYGWVVDSEIPLEYLSDPYHPLGGQAQDVYVKDLNGDGIIDDDDKTILGNPYPDLVWSLSNDFKIYNFDFSFMFQGSHGAQVRNMADQYLFNHFNSAQDFISSTPNQEFIKEKIFTNSIVQDASYVALRTINIGYNLPRDVVEKLQVNKLRLYISGQNLMYFTADGYTGWNPESIDETSGTTYGYQRGGSPINQTVSVGLNVEF
ncbi:SusC/RagA family TonB-linked outer membrane protein [Olleya sp. Bg11-27]|uniref:SusC/RagA family TonB-linked outer membrane protein n=1 Tax=Olleya sp. Bg11-27 TaxID=2058135 RepID=UPI000C311B5B|nr:SusC/RagA family TonB-linked outer membrane protein [Olleya sp. Bg11-27]AUC74209.1 SusC/RagA family TonB-linked outer membrane protein [Olleya sp. Bg11-27]